MNGMIGDRLRKWLGGSARAAASEAAAETGGWPTQVGPNGSSRSADQGSDENAPAMAGRAASGEQAQAPGGGRLDYAAPGEAHPEAEALANQPAQVA